MAFKMKGSPMHRNFGVGSPAKQKKTGTTVYEGRDNEKGQSQNDVINMREKKVKDYNDAVKPYVKNGVLDLTEEQFKKYEINFNKKRDANTFSRDSIDTKNAEINLDIKNKNKKADDSGLFSQGSPNKQKIKNKGHMEGPIPEQNIGVQPGENDNTWIYGRGYEGDDSAIELKKMKETEGRLNNNKNIKSGSGTSYVKDSRIGDYEDRASTIEQNALESSDKYLGRGSSTRGAKKRKKLKNTVKTLDRESQIMRDRKD